MTKQRSVREDIAKSICDIGQVRLFNSRTVHRMHESGHKEAKYFIAMAKTVTSSMACKVKDLAIQIDGTSDVGLGFC